MQKDINVPKVENISVAIIEELNEEKTANVFNVYLINEKNIAIENVLVSAKGYGENKTTGEKIKTSILRHGLGSVQANSFAKIEPIMEDLFGVNNEYWVSFFENNTMLDKKYIFLAETVQKANYVNVPLINKKGILIK